MTSPSAAVKNFGLACYRHMHSTDPMAVGTSCLGESLQKFCQEFICGLDRATLSAPALPQEEDPNSAGGKSPNKIKYQKQKEKKRKKKGECSSCRSSFLFLFSKAAMARRLIQGWMRFCVCSCNRVYLQHINARHCKVTYLQVIM